MHRSRPPQQRIKSSANRRAVRRIATLIVLTLLALIYISGVAKPVVHFDMFHQMALMREALKLGHVPTVDLFAYTASIEPAIQHEWGAGLIALIVLNNFGANGILALHYLLSALIGVGIFALASARRARAPLMWASVAAVGYLLTYSAQPVVAQTYSLLFFAVLLAGIQRDRTGNLAGTDAENPRNRSGNSAGIVAGIAAGILMGIAWGNVHGGVVVGVGVLFVYAIEQAVHQRPWKHIAVLALAMIGLLSVSPYGFKIYPFLLHALTAERPIIGEWNPAWMLTLDRYRTIVFAVTLAVFAYSVWRRGWRNMQGVFIVLVLGLASIRAMKMLPFYALAWLVYVPKSFGHTPLGREIASGILRNLRWYGMGSVVLIGMALVSIARREPLTLAIPNEPQPRYLNVYYPVGAVEYLREQGFKGNLMTPYEQGAYVSWKLYPDVKVGMDSRYETAYDMAWINRAHYAYYDQPPGAWKGVLNAYPTDAVLVSALSPLSERLAQSAEWRLMYRDAAWRVYSRSSATPRPAD